LRLLVTGGPALSVRTSCGWCSSAFRHRGRQPRQADLCRHLENLAGLERDPRHRFVQGHLRSRLGRGICSGGRTPWSFRRRIPCGPQHPRFLGVLRTNVLGTLNLLDAARSTDPQVCAGLHRRSYGSLGPVGAFTEATPLAPNSRMPQASRWTCWFRSYCHTHRLPPSSPAASNNYALISSGDIHTPRPPTPDRDAPPGLRGRSQCGLTMSGITSCPAQGASRGRLAPVYNIGSRQERSNLEIARMILKSIGKGKTHQFREGPLGRPSYAIDLRRSRCELGGSRNTVR